MKPKLITLLLLASLSSFAQVNVKKGIIYEADKPIGKVSGRLSAFRSANLDFLTMEGQSILTVKEEVFEDIKFPPFTNYKWYTISFSDSKKELKIQNITRCYNEKCIIELLAKNGIAINGNLIANQDEVIAKIDYSPTLQADTVKRFTDEERALSSKLLAIQINRNKSSEIMTWNTPEYPTKTTKLVQDRKTIGWIVKETVGTWTEEATIYKFYKSSASNPDPSIADDPNEKIYVAFFKLMEVVRKGFTYQDLTRQWLPAVADWRNAEVELAKFLIEKGYL
jgi:hypothetical protein